MVRYLAFVVGGALIGWSLSLSPAVSERETSARPPSPPEAQVLAALEEPSELDFGEQPLNDVVSYLEQKHHVPIQLDRKALGEAGIRSNARITGALQGVSLRSLLRLLLAQRDLAYVTCDGYLLVTTKVEAANRLPSRVYPVGDLVTTDSEFRSLLQAGEPTGVDFQNLTEVITSVVEPTTWDEVGGPGTVSKCGNDRMLAVSQTEEVHEQIAALLAALRRVRDKQIASAKSADPFRRSGSREANDRGDLEVRVYRFFQVPVPAPAPGPAPAPAPVPDANSSEASRKAAEEIAAARLDAWTKVIARLAPEMIAPESWKPAGDGQIRAVSGTIVVRQSADVQCRVAKLIYEMMLPGVDSGFYPLGPVYRCYAPVRLSMPRTRVKWPQEAEPQPRGAEARIIAALEERCDVDFEGEPLSRVMTVLAQRHQIQIQIDHKALREAGGAADVPVTRAFRGLRLKPALKLLLDELELACVIRDEVLLITSKAQAEEAVVTKVYPVFDLVVRRPGASSRTPALDFQPLIESMTSTLAPTTWDEVGGPGNIQPFTNAGALVISQTDEVHEEIAAFLQAMREFPAAQ